MGRGIRRASKSARFSRSIPSIKPKRVVPDKKVVKKPTTVKKVTKATTFKKTTPPTVKPTPPKPKVSVPRASKATARVRLPGKKIVKKFLPSKVVPKPVQVKQPVAKVKTFTTTKKPTKRPTKTVPKKSVTELIALSKKTPPVVAVNINPKSKPVQTVPLIPGIPGFVSGLPLVAGSVSPIPFQEDTPVSAGEQAFKLEGFKATDQGFKIGGGGAEKERAKALDITPVVLSEEPGEVFTEVIPSTEKPTEETRTFIDPVTGLLTEEKTTTTPGDTVVTTLKGGVQTIGKSEIESDFSDPVGSLFTGASQSALNEVIGIKNVGALATGGEQEEFFATPSAIVIGGAIDAGTSFFGDIGGALFDLGRQAAGKKKVEIGQTVTSFGIAGDQVTIEQKARKKDATKILTESGERFSRVVQADPLFAVGDFAVQGALLAVAPVKAASLAIRGLGVLGKATKLASKGTGAIKGRGLLSATGEAVTAPKPKSPLSSTFIDEFTAFEQKAPELAKIKDLSKLSTKQRQALKNSQRQQFEKKVTELQEGKRPIGETTADFGKRSSGTLIKVTKKEAQQEAADFFERVGRKDLIPKGLQRAIEPQGEGLFGRLVGTAGSPPQTIAGRAVERDFQSLLKLEIKLEKSIPDSAGKSKGPALTLKELAEFDRLKSGQAAKVEKAALDPTGEALRGKIGGIRKEVDIFGPQKIDEKGQLLQRFGDTGKTTLLGKADPGFSPSRFDDGFNFGSAGKGGGKGGGDFFGTGVDLGRGVQKSTPKITKDQISKIAKAGKIDEDSAEGILRGFGEAGGDVGKITSKTGLLLIEKSATKQTSALKTLEKARKALQEGKSAKTAVSSIADQKTQRRLSDLIKKEKLRKPSTKADLATQKALKKLIAEEKAKSVTKATKLSSKVDNLFSAPKKTRGIATEADTIFRKPRSKLGILGGVATGVAIGSGVGLGLNIKQIEKPLQTQQLFDSEISRVVKDPTVNISRNIFGPDVTQKQQSSQDSIFNVPDQRTTQKQTPRLFTTIFQTPRTDITQRQQSVTERIDQPLQQITTTTFQTPPVFPPGSGFGFPFEGSRKDELKESKSQRRFFRVFDIAKTPFGKIDVGLGAQRQSDRPIFEFLEEDERKGKAKARPKNLGEEFFSI